MSVFRYTLIIGRADVLILDTEEQKQRLRDDPEYYLKYRKAVEAEMNGNFLAFHVNTPHSKGGMRVSNILLSGI